MKKIKVFFIIVLKMIIVIIIIFSPENMLMFKIFFYLGMVLTIIYSICIDKKFTR